MVVMAQQTQMRGSLGGGEGKIWPGGAIATGCAQAGLLANKPTIRTGTIERGIDAL